MVLAAAAFALASCAEQVRVTSYKPFFTGIGEAEFGGQAPVNPLNGRADPTVTPPDLRTIVEHPNGRKTYLTPAPSILMAHVESLLAEGTAEADKTILDQLIDENTKEHYRRHNADPADYIAYLHENRKQIVQTFARMPMGEHTPTVIVEQPGDRQWALKLTGQAARELKFTEVWVRQEMGMWRLEWLR
jgi:hypothetical protein